MYSLVLMAAIGTGPGTAGADQPAVVVAGSPVVVVGCTGCTGYSAGCSGCVSYSAGCTGCTGHRLFGHRASCHGCCGGVVAYSSCHGCCGGGFLGHKHHSSGCCGGASCFGSCSGYINNSAWGNCHGCGGGVPSTYYYPSYSTPILTGAAPFYYTGPTHHSAPVVVPPAKVEEEKKGASLQFNLPVGAVLFVDGVKTTGDTAERTFYTPVLEAGQKYFYDVRAEITIDGKSIVEEKRVIVEAGAQIRESFPKMIAAVAAASNVAGK